MTTRWERLQERRAKPEPYNEETWAEAVSDCMQRLIRHPDGERLLDLLFQRFVFSEQKLGISESALRADMAVRNLVLLLDRLAHEGSAHARSGDPERSSGGEGPPSGE
jgi:hypothetical protein